ncbi:MAG: hypothetical protein K2H86_00145 [Muribaculaceae bacterium]|nr:hypothetical protein [Muribaculaceae bacterium]
MKSYSSTISVNPSTQTMGERNSKAICALEESVRIANEPFRSSFLNSAEENSSLIPITLKFLFGVYGRQNGISAPMDALTLIARCGFGLFICGMALAGMTGISSVAMAVIGVMVTLGCMTRASLLALAVMQIVAASSLHAGLNDMHLIVALISGVMAILGPGHTSLDSILERLTSRNVESYMLRKEREHRDSYRAYEFID